MKRLRAISGREVLEALGRNMPGPNDPPNSWGYIFPVSRRQHVDRFKAEVIARYPDLRVEVEVFANDPAQVCVNTYPTTHELRSELMRDHVLGRLHQRLSGMRTMLL